MILKSMARKTPSYTQLIAYLDREEPGASYTHNCWSQSSIGDELAKEFETNYAYLPKRKNGNSLYHEVIAMPSHPDLSVEKQEKVLMDLAQKYLQLRAKNQMAYVKVHHDKENIHAHLMISSNEVGSKKRTRLSRSQFQQVKQELEAYKLKKYGEYFAEQFFQRTDRNPNRQSHKEYELAKRTGLPTKRQMVQQVVRTAMLNAKTEEELKAELAKSGLEYYTRGKKQVPGVIDKSSGKRYRLKSIDCAFPSFGSPHSLRKNGLYSIEQK